MRQIGKTKSMFYAFILVLVLVISVSEQVHASTDSSPVTHTSR